MTLNADNSGAPGGFLCTLVDPRTWTSILPFGAPATCPTLAANTTYFVVIERVAFTAGGINLYTTTDGDEDSEAGDRAAGWSIGNDCHIFSGGSWSKSTGSVLMIEVRRGVAADRRASEDFTLAAGDGHRPTGLWADGTTMWVADAGDFRSAVGNIYAYDMATKQRDSAKDFNTLTAAGNHDPAGIWSDGTTMWVVDATDKTIYAYDMATKQRDTDKEVLGTLPARPGELWVDNNTTWVLKRSGPPVAVLAWNTETGNRKTGKDFTGLHYNENRSPGGIWADGSDLFVSDSLDGKVYAYWKNAKWPNARRYFLLSPLQGEFHGGSGGAGAIWSDGTTIWVADYVYDKLFAYTLPPPVAGGPLGVLKDRVSTKYITEKSAMVEVDVGGLPFGGERYALSISINRGGATIYVHPDASTARFMLNGLDADTEYEVETRVLIKPSYPMGAMTFKTADAPSLNGIEISDLTHTAATVTVSLEGAGADRRCCFPYEVNRDRSDPEHTYYLRYKRESTAPQTAGPIPLR